MTAPMPETMSPRDTVFVSATCGGESCHCGSPAVRKVGEEIPYDDPNPRRHNYTAYVCARHYAELMGPSGARSVGYAALASSGDHAELARLAEAALKAGDPFYSLGEIADWGEFHVAANPATVLALLAEVAALRSSLTKANDGFEEYERKFYLEQDAREEAERKLAKAVEWRPIETAPRDGSRFLAYGGGLDDQVETCSWSETTCCWNLETFTADDSDDEPEGYCRPTHWLPLPPAPGAEDE